MSGDQAFLKLPPLGKCQKANSYNKEDDIYKMFIKLSRLHCKLQDPLKELLYQCACEDEGECNGEFNLFFSSSEMEISGKSDMGLNSITKFKYPITSGLKSETYLASAIFSFEKKLNVNGFHGFSFENLLTSKELHRELYLSPAPDHVQLWKRNISNRLAEEHRQFRWNIKDTPMSTIIVRWIKRNMLASYDYHSVIQELKRFGALESVTPFGRQTAVVTFKDITSACKAVNAFPANNPGRRIQCVWHHKFMSEYKMSGHRKIKLTSY